MNIASDKPASNSFLARRFTRALLRKQRGRAFMLYQLAEAEVADEGLVFERLVASVQDPELAKMVRKHRDDEQRHNKMLLEAARTTGIESMPIPVELSMVLRLDRQLGSLAEAFISGTVGVLHACALLLVLEERAVREYPLAVEVMREFDPASADVLARVLADERRHVRYAIAVGRKYARDELEFFDLVTKFRIAEERAFMEHTVAMTQHALDNDLLDMGFVERAAWRALMRLTELRLGSSRTVTAPTSVGGSVPEIPVQAA